ncbi:MAG: 30S ribosomal protein S17 [Phycisphaerales bacterium]
MSERNAQSTKIALVTSDKREKSRRVEIEFQQKHEKYGKYLRKRSVLHVHDEGNESKAGDKVEIERCAPMSRTKHWRVVRVVEKASV